MSANIERVEFLPYHKYGISKYQKLDIRYEGDDFTEPEDTIIEAAAGILKKKKLSCFKSGAGIR